MKCVLVDIEYGLPMGLEIGVGCTILGNDLHQYDSEKVFSLKVTDFQEVNFMKRYTEIDVIKKR